MRRHSHIGLQLAAWRTVFFFHTEFELGWHIRQQRAVAPFPYYASAVRKLANVDFGDRGCQSSALPARIIANKSWAPNLGCLQISYQRPGKAVLVHNVSKDLILARGHRWELADKCAIRLEIRMWMPHSLHSRNRIDKQM